MSEQKDNNGFVFTPIQGPNGPLTAVLVNEYACFKKYELQLLSESRKTGTAEEKNLWDAPKMERVSQAAFSLLYRLFKLDGGPLRIREDLIKMYEIVSTSEDFDQMNREDKEDLRLSYSEAKELLEAAADIFNINSPMQGHRAESVKEG